MLFSQKMYVAARFVASAPGSVQTVTSKHPFASREFTPKSSRIQLELAKLEYRALSKRLSTLACR